MSSRALAVVAALTIVVAAMTGTAVAGPANDNFADATVVSGTPFVSELSTVGATTEPGEPDGIAICASGGASVWYSFTPATDGRLLVSTTGSGFGAYFGIYSGTQLGNLDLLACASETALRVSGGATYLLQAGGTTYNDVDELVPASGDLRLELNLLPPCEACVTFEQYAVPSDRFRYRAGETSIGVNFKNDAALFEVGGNTLRARWDDSVSPASVQWDEVGEITTSLLSLDPILWTDQLTGRTFVAQLLGAGSAVAYTDDDGMSWTRSQPASVAPSFDHETVGGGPYPASLRGINPVYPNAVYYCAQLAISQCTRSDDGGLTWGAPLPMNALKGCGGLHGHIVVSADGTVLVPHKSCGSANGGQGVIVSTDAGTTWTLRRVPGTVGARSDPGIAFDRAGRLYFATSSDGRPVVVTSDDEGATWSKPRTVALEFGLRNVEFPMVVAGDEGRAAMAFYGTTDGGSDQSSGFTGEWHLYVSVTYDGGASWATVDVTPTIPSSGAASGWAAEETRAATFSTSRG